MTSDVRRLLLLTSFAFLTNGCGEDVAAYTPESPASVVQNLHYTTNIYNTPTSTFAIDSPPVLARPTPTVTRLPPPTVVPPPLRSPTLPTPTGTGISIIPPPPVAMVHPPEVLPRNVSPVGIASCDAYLTHVEFCSRRMLSKLARHDAEEATAKIVMSLDMSRRAWRNAIPDMTPRARASLAETCSDSIRLYDMGAKSACAE